MSDSSLEKACYRLQTIRDLAGPGCDDEALHGMEDDFREFVLTCISDGDEDAVTLAKLALSTNDLDFARWCA